MFKYAQVNAETGIVEGVCRLRDEGMEKENPNLIPIEDDFNLSYKKWDFETETWVEYIPEPEPETPEKPTEIELQWQAITDLEISQMEYDQALTDLEIAYLEGSAKA